MSDEKIAEIRARHAQSEKNYIELEATWKAQVHEDRAFLLDEVERLTRERDEARAEVKRMRGDAQAIAAIAHTGGTAGLSEHEALVEIRRRTLKAWDRRTSRKALEAKP